MTNKIVAIQGNHPSKLNIKSDTSIFLAVEAQNKNYKIFYYEPNNLSIINGNHEHMNSLSVLFFSKNFKNFS